MPRWLVPTYEERHGGKTRSIPENEKIAGKLKNAFSEKNKSGEEVQKKKESERTKMANQLNMLCG